MSWFDDKRYVLEEGIYTLVYFHKDKVTSCKEIKKDCNKKKTLKKIVKRLKKILIKKIVKRLKKILIKKD